MNAINPLAPAPSAEADARGAEPSMEEILASIRRIIADDQTLPPRAPSREPPPVIDASRVAEATPTIAEPIPLRRPDPVPVARTTPAEYAPALTERANEASAERDDDEASASVYPGHGQIAPQFPMPDVPTPDAAPAMPSHQRPVLPPFFAAAAQAFDSGRDPARPAESGAARERSVPPSPDGEPRRGSEGPRATAPDLLSTQAHQSVSSAFNMLAATRLADNSEELLGLARELIRPLLKTWIDDNLPTMVERLVRAEIERVARGGR